MKTLLKCGHCGSEEFIETRCVSGPHDAKVSCKNCQGFMKWGQSPERQVRVKELAARIRCSMQFPEAVSSWEWDVLCNIEHAKRLTPKQEAILKTIETKLGGSI